MITRIFLFFAFLLLFIGCSKKDASNASDNRCGSDPVGEIIVDKGRFQHSSSEIFYPDTAYIEDHTLVCRLSYGGGCDYANLEMLSNGEFSTGIFPHVELRPIFIDEDPCEALLTADFCFDLNSLAFVPSKSEVAIILSEWNVVLKWNR